MLEMGCKCKDPCLAFIGGVRKVGTVVWGWDGHLTQNFTLGTAVWEVGRPSQSNFCPETGVSNVGRASHLNFAIWDGRLDPWDDCLELF
ncbi:unnamed protein product, partial [Sphenostylis stenocarpa]